MTNANAGTLRKKVVDLLEARNGIPPHADESELLIAFLTANKYPLLALASPGQLGHAWQDELDRASESYNEQRQEYLRAREQWLRLGIGCIAFKSAGIPPSFPYTSDNLDLLIRREHQSAAIEALEDLGYVWLTNTDEREKLLFRKFRSGRCVSAIHLHTWIGWDAEFHDLDAVWARARTSEDDPHVTIPSPEDAILINVAHALYENKRFSLFDLEKVRRHWASPGLDWAYMEAIAQGRGWLDGLYFGLAVCAFVERRYFGRCTAPPTLQRKWLTELRRRPPIWWYYRRLTGSRHVNLPFRVSFSVSKLLYYKKILSDQHDTAGRRMSNFLHTLAWGAKQKSGLNPQPGMLITFSGIDGSGKTAHAAALSRALSVCGVTHVRVWSRPGCSPLYRALAAARRKFTAAPDSTTPSGQPQPAPGGKAARLLWAILNVLDLAIVYNWSVRRRLLVGNVIVCDRYATDAEVELAERLPGQDRLARRIIAVLHHLSPAPQVAYLLDLPPTEAANRSADPENVIQLERQRQAYLRLAHQRKMWMADALRDFGQLSDDIVRDTLRTYFRRFDTLLNGLLLSNPGQLNAIGRRLRQGGAR